MRIKIHIDSLRPSEYDEGLKGLHLELEADMSGLNRLTSADEQRKFIDNALHVLDYHNEKPEAVKTYIKAVVGGIAGGILETIEEHISPFARVRRKIMNLLNRINPLNFFKDNKAKKHHCAHCRGESVLDKVSPEQWDRNIEDFDQHVAEKLATSLNQKEV